MPVGWVEPTIAPYYQSAYKKGLTITGRLTKRDDTSILKCIISVEFILFLSWISLSHLSAGFVMFTWVLWVEFDLF